MKNVRFWLAVCGVLIPFVAGCNSEETESISLTGSVAYQGTPVESGTIVFRNNGKNVRVDQKELRDVHANITAGRFEVGPTEGLVPGSYRVEIYSPQETGRMISDPDEPDMQAPEVVERLPAKYNEMSELVENIGDSTTEISFDLD